MKKRSGRKLLRVAPSRRWRSKHLTFTAGGLISPLAEQAPDFQTGVPVRLRRKLQRVASSPDFQTGDELQWVALYFKCPPSTEITAGGN